MQPNHLISNQIRNGMARFDLSGDVRYSWRLRPEIRALDLFAQSR